MRRPSVRLLAPAVAAGAVLALVPATASAAPQRFRACPGAARLLCARVAVPLDRGGAVPGVVRLLVVRVKGRPRRPGVLLALAGGPGQASTPLLESFAEAAGPALGRRELVVFDQRGTGASNALRCPSLEGRWIRDLALAGERCAARLGTARAHYATRDSIADVEAVREALGAERMSLLGVSYGTKVALGYAIAHPGRVDRLVLDSPVAPDGPDVFVRSSFAAIPGALRDVCRGRRCRGVTPDPVADVGLLAGRLRAGPLVGTVIGPRGQRRLARLRTSGLLAMLFASDVDPLLLSAIPGVVRSASRGDAAPVLRLLRLAAAGDMPDDPRDFSNALLAATLCEESAFPWSRTAAPERRREELGAALWALGDGPFAPFDRTAPIALYSMPLCYRWPTGPAAPDFATAPLPPAPALVLSGSLDLRTPPYDAHVLAARLPDARVLSATGAGHSVLSSAETPCAGRALRDFFAGRPVRRRCPRDPELDLPPDPPAPLSLREVPPAPGLGGKPGRTVNAVLLTAGDGFFALLSTIFDEILDPRAGRRVSAGGLRGGWVSVGRDGIVFHRLSYVPGVTVSGRVVQREGRLGVAARFRVGGRAAARGALRIDADGRIAGRLGGRRVRLRIPGGRAAVAGRGATLPRLRILAARLRGARPSLSGRPARFGDWIARAGAAPGP